MDRQTHTSPEDLIEILHTPTCPFAEASRLAGLSAWRVKAWLKGYEYKYEVGDKIIEGYQNPVVDPESSDIQYASFLDLIDLLFVKRFLKNGISLQSIRKMLDEAREILGTPHFARSTFFTSGNQVLLELPEYRELIALQTGKQFAIREIFEKIGEKLDFETVTGYGLAERWFPNGKNGMIVIDPQISFGRPTVINHRITTENIYDLYLGEGREIPPVCNWFDLPEPKVKAAISFESTLAL